MWGFVRSTMMWFERVIANAAGKGKRDKRMTLRPAEPVPSGGRRARGQLSMNLMPSISSSRQHTCAVLLIFSG
jgi:hypothetical protein